jgi:hypothetical protein
MKVAPFLLVLSSLWAPCADAELCSPNACGGDVSACFTAVDWVAEAEILNVSNGRQQLCTLGLPVKCVDVWDGGRVQLRITRMQKGKLASEFAGIVVTAEARCWEDRTRVPEEYVGRRVRIFGFYERMLTDGAVSLPGLARVVLLQSASTPNKSLKGDVAKATRP